MSIVNRDLIDKNNKLLNKQRFKYPDRQLVFKKSEYKAKVGSYHVAYNNELWFLGHHINDETSTFRIMKTADIEGAVTEGVVWNWDWGHVQHIVAFTDGSFAAVTRNTGGVSHVRVYKFDSINDDTPVLVYENTETYLIHDFGFSSSTNGDKTVCLMGEYGGGTQSKRVLLSVDNGSTWNIVRETGDKSSKVHWHDVEVDDNRGLLWAASGDHPGQAYIEFSADMGATWITLSPEHSDVDQPTAIMSFPEFVIFGGDRSPSELRSVTNPRTREEWDALFTGEGFPKLHQHTHKRSGYNNYPSIPKKYGNMEGMYSERSYDDMIPSRIFMTGDGGRSFHVVAIRNHFTDDIKGLEAVALDDRYVYAYITDGERLVYANKPLFV